jgi:hypothetical protein
MSAALWVVAGCDVAPFRVWPYCRLELHAEGTLTLDVNAVNDPYDD